MQGSERTRNARGHHRAADLPEAVRRASLGLGVRSALQPQDHIAVGLALSLRPNEP